MAKKIQDLKPDTVLKNYWNNKEQFADLFNAVLFQGRGVIRAEELEDIDTEESSLLEHREYTESIQASRDNIKIRKKAAAHGVELVMLAKEAQEHIHYAMPMRIMGYDYGTYKKQYDSNGKKYKTEKGLERDEYLSRMRKTDKLVPVITLVVYYGEKPWDGAISLHGMLQIGEEFVQYVNDYKMLLVEARQNNLQLHNINNVDLFNLFEILLDTGLDRKEAREKAIQYSEEHETDPSVIMTIAGASSCKIDYRRFGKGGGGMFTIFEELAQEHEALGEARGVALGEARGEARGIVETGFDFGLSEQDILGQLQKKLNISLQKAQEYFQMFGKQAL